MKFQLRIDKNSFQFHIIFLGMNPIKDVFAARHNPPWPSRLHTQSAVRPFAWFPSGGNDRINIDAGCHQRE
jgi:hypothetical protein